MDPKSEETSSELDSKGVLALVRRAEGGDAQALRQVRDLCHTRLARVWEAYANPARNLEDLLVNAAAGENALQKAALTTRMAELRRELGGPDPSPLERLLVERIALCWLQMYLADSWDAQALGQNRTFAAGEHAQARADRAQRRFLSAVKALGTVRRLALPLIQVNVADQQVVANGEVGTRRG